MTASTVNHKVPFLKNAALFLVGGATQMSFFISFFSVDYLNFFFGPLKPEFYLSISVSLFSFIGAILTLIRPFSTFYRIPMTTCFVLSAVFASLVPVFVYLQTDGVLTNLQAFILVNVVLAALGFFESINSGCVFSFLGKYYGSQAVQLGQSGTTWVSMSIYVLRVILKLSLPQTQSGFLLSGYLEFGLIALWMVACALLSVWITSTVEPDAEQKVLLQSGVESINKSDEDYTESDGSFRAVFGRVKLIVISMALGLILNQMFYPGVFSVLHGATSGWFDVIMFGFFAVGDTAGQTLPRYFRVYRLKTMWLFPISQVILIIPMALALQIWFWQPFFGSDAYAYILALIWGFNVGSGVCCHMMMITDVETVNKGLASTCAIVCLQTGLIIASLLGIAMQFAGVR